MSSIPEHLKTFEEIEREGISLASSRCFERRASREEGIEIVRYALWDTTGWRRDYSPRLVQPAY